MRQQRAGKKARKYFEGAFDVRMGEGVVKGGGVEACICIVAAIGSGQKVSEGALASTSWATAAEEEHVFSKVGKALNLRRVVHLATAYGHCDRCYERARVTNNDGNEAIGQCEAGVLPVVNERLSNFAVHLCWCKMFKMGQRLSSPCGRRRQERAEDAQALPCDM